MNINKKNTLLFALIAIVIIFIKYEPSKLDNYKLDSKAILYLDEVVFEMYHKKYDTNKDLNRYWGYSKELSAEEIAMREKALNEKIDKKKTKITYENGKNVLCIIDSCYRLVGIHYNYRTPIVTLYNKDLKEKIKNYKKKDIIDKKVIVNNISSHEVEFINLETDEKYYFEQFDVNQTKYKPKEVQE